MFARFEIPSGLLELAGQQSGVITREQCLAFGVGDRVRLRLLEIGMWQQLAPGVHVIHGGPVEWLALAWAGVLIGGDRAVLAGEAAAFLWGLRASAPEVLPLELPHTDWAPRSTGPWFFQRTRNPVRGYGEPPRKPAADTVLDLLIAHPDRRAKILADADHHKISFKAILAAMDARQRLPDRRLIEAILGRVRAGVHSELEHIYARDVERAHGLPKGVRQHFDGRYRTDVRYGRIIVELDGRAGHAGLGVFRDMERDNDHALSGDITLRYGWDDCTWRACAAARQVGTLLFRQGWPGPFQTCPNCREVPVP